jgi:uncharacterized membrane protein
LTALLALSAAFGFGVAGVFLKRALQYVNPLPAAVLSVTFTTAVVWGLALSTTSLAGLATLRIVPFVVAGMIAPGLARLALFTGIARVGVARAYAVGSIAPLVSIVLAILFLGERPSWLLLLGAAAIVVGGILLSQRPPGDRSWRRRDLVFAGLAAFGFAVRDNVTRYGFREFADPVLAAAVSTATSVTIMWSYATLAARRELRIERSGLGLLMCAGVAEGFAYVTMWRALAGGSVAMVSPLTNSHSIFAVVLAALFLRDLERVTWRIGVATVLIVAGVMIVLRFGAR